MMILFILTAVHDDNLLFRSMLKTGTRSISGYDQLDLGFITRDRSIVLNYDHIRKLFNTLDTRLHPSKQPSEVEAGAALFEFINELVAVSEPHNIAWSGAHCACTPSDLAKIVKPGPIAARENNGKRFIAFTGKIATREQYEAAMINNNADGSQRVQCPALAGKVACPHCPETMGVSAHLPIVNTNGADLSDVPMCNQKTTTITAVARGKVLQKERYGSSAWIDSYARRSSVERKNGFLKDPADGLITRGKWHVHGLVKNALMVALAVIAHNIHSARVWASEYNQQHVDPMFLESDSEYSVSLTQADIDRFQARRAPPSKAA